jgi:hypothetical protein
MPYPSVTTNQALTSSYLNTNYSDQVVSTVLSTGKPTGTEGQLIAVTNQDRLEVYSGTAWVRVGNWSSAGRTGTVLRRAATQSIATATDTKISFDTEDTDTDGFIAVTATDIVVPSGLDGIYLITGTVAWASSPGANSNVRIELGGTTGDYRTHCGTGTVAYQNQVVSAVTALAATNTISLRCYQATGASINVTARIEVWRLAR